MKHPKDREALAVAATGALLLALLLTLATRIRRTQPPLATPRPPSDSGRR